MERITITGISVEEKRVSMTFKASPKLTHFFLKRDFFCEYNIKVKDVPSAIAVIPLVCNLLPIIWLTDAELIVPELDEDFYNSIERFKRGYIDMYPMLEFKGKVWVDKLVKQSPADSGRAGCFFSGGVDAFNTLYQHYGEEPDLITVRGADLKLADEEGWVNVLNHAECTASRLGLQLLTVKSNFHEFLNETAVYQLIKTSGDGWWHGFQHGIGLIGLAAPLTFANGLSTIYIASTYTAAERGTHTCASDPTIDSHVRFCGCRIVHDGYEFTRMDKVRNICTLSAQTALTNPVLRVCWIESGGKNCCRCEKCLRTIFELLALGMNPARMGFEDYESGLSSAKTTVLKAYSLTSKPFWIEIQRAFREVPVESVPQSVRWIIDCNFARESRKSSIRTRKLLDKIRWKIKSLV